MVMFVQFSHDINGKDLHRSLTVSVQIQKLVFGMSVFAF